jgi:hypothetical protein
VRARLGHPVDDRGEAQRQQDEAARVDAPACAWPVGRVLLRVNPRLASFISERRLAPMRRMMAALDARERAALIKALGLFADEIERGAS